MRVHAQYHPAAYDVTRARREQVVRGRAESVVRMQKLHPKAGGHSIGRVAAAIQQRVAHLVHGKGELTSPEEYHA
jgi:hypothetical protein